MFGRGSDRLADAARLIAASAALASDPTLLSATKSGPGAYDALKRLLASPPPGVARLGDELAAQARALFDETRDLPPDAEALYAQMIEASALDAPALVAAGMDPEAATEAMIARLEDPAHRTVPMLALFRAVTVPTLRRALADMAFADELRAAFMAEVLRRLGGLTARLDMVDRLTRLELTALGDRFEIAAMFAMSDAELRAALELKAEEWRAYRDRIEAIDERTAGLGNLKAAARDAAARLELEEVEALLARVDEVETEIAAETKVLRAENALLRGRVEEAERFLSAAADGFASVDPVEPARRRLRYAVPLYEHGERYDSAGLWAAARMWRQGLLLVPRQQEPELWAGTNLNLGNALTLIGQRLGGVGGLGHLREASDCFRMSLEVWSLESDGIQWATIQNSLGVCLSKIAAALGRDGGGSAIREAVYSLYQAKQFWQLIGMTANLADTQDNYANALAIQALFKGDSARKDLLLQAKSENTAALASRTKGQDPIAWAKTRMNLGLLCAGASENVDCRSPCAELCEASEHLAAAAAVFDAEEMPHDHSKAIAALARVRAALAARDCA